MSKKKFKMKNPLITVLNRIADKIEEWSAEIKRREEIIRKNKWANGYKYAHLRIEEIGLEEATEEIEAYCWGNEDDFDKGALQCIYDATRISESGYDG